MGFFKKLFSKKDKNNNEEEALYHLTLRQLREQKMYFRVPEEQLDMTLGEYIAMQKAKPEEKQPEEIASSKKVFIEIDDSVIQSNDIEKIMEPLRHSVSIDDGEEKYEAGLSCFSTPQRYLYAIQCYIEEINSGGHEQFYYNASGMVWADVLKAFEALGAAENVRIVKESAGRIGGLPSKDRDKRQKQLDEYEPNFDDLDAAYYDSEMDMGALLCAYIQSHAQDFYFSGEVMVSNH